MKNYNEEIKSFNELIDPKSKPVHKLAKFIGVSPEEIYEKLCEAYDNALKNDELISDSSGIMFSAEFADILLSRNNDLTSKYDRYLNFTLNNEYINNLIREEGTGACIIPNDLENVILPPTNLLRLNRFMCNVEEMPSDKIISQLKESYIECKRNNGLIPHEEGYNFSTGLKTYNGFPIIAGIKPVKTPEGRSNWLFNYVGYEISSSECQISDIEKFAGISRSSCLADIEKIAREEKWFFRDEAEGCDILENFINYTFSKLKKEDKIAYSCDGRMAAINTGLADKYFNDIYMCFTKDDSDSQYEWKYMGVCTATGRKLGKMLISNFKSLPEPACYISRKEDMFYETDRKLFPDMDHILLDRIYRIPVEFLKKVLCDYPKALKLVEAAEICDGSYVYTIFEEIADYLREDDEAFDCLCSAFENVLSKTLKALRWDYRLAIPCYFPKRDIMSLLLPLDFTECGTPQAALVAELTPTGSYIGHTILTMKQAYINARLISRQDRSWLSA